MHYTVLRYNLQIVNFFLHIFLNSINEFFHCKKIGLLLKFDLCNSILTVQSVLRSYDFLISIKMYFHKQNSLII